MGTSLCQAIRMPELICDSPVAYVREAVALGRSPQRLAALKSRLAAAVDTAPLFQPQVLVATLEDAYRRLWRHHRETAVSRSKLPERSSS